MKYLVIGGSVSSKSDGQTHYFSPQKLIRLYGVPRNECILIADFGSDKLMGLDTSNLVTLRPRSDGNYQLI